MEEFVCARATICNSKSRQGINNLFRMAVETCAGQQVRKITLVQRLTGQFSYISLYLLAELTYLCTSKFLAK